MTGRSVPEWIGATPDTPVPPRVKDRVFLRFDGRCHACTRKVRPGEPWTCEHLKALINGGENRENNLGITCENCLPDKNAADVAEKSLVARKRAKHLGLKKAKRPFPGSVASGLKKKMNGEVVRRTTHD
jgi:5-methylcytosine-specific restriction protein A